MHLEFSEPVLVAMGPKSREAGWGPHQFAQLTRLKDGNLLYTFILQQDSEVDYGLDEGGYLSRDNGKTWIPGRRSQYKHLYGIHLDNGETIQWIEPNSIPVDEGVTFEGEGAYTGHIERKDQYFYPTEKVKCEGLNEGWLFERYKDGATEPVIEEATFKNWDKKVHRVARGVLCRPFPNIKHIRQAPDGTLWIPAYGIDCNPKTGELSLFSANFLCKSTDGGHSWELVHYMSYDPEKYKEIDPRAHEREGWSENDIAFCPDGKTMVKLIRTDGLYPRTEHCRYNSSYITHSTDGGYTWEEPEIFDDRGVMPILHTMKCGVTLAGYGRPGLFVRASFDPQCRKWEDRIEIIHSPGTPNDSESCVDVHGTCSYCDFVEIDDHTAGFAYSDFRVKDENGDMRKCLMYRTITVVED